MTGIVTNPIILGIVAGLLWSALGLPLSGIPGKTIGNIASMATPLGLMAMGASFDIQKAVQKGRPAIVASVMKLVGFCVIFLPVAIAFGFREEELVAILVMLGSATTVSCYVMARNMGHEGVLTSQHCHADHAVQRVYPDRLAVPAKKRGPDLEKSRQPENTRA